MLIMIKYPFLCLLVIITSSAIAQSTKAYIDKNGHSTNKIQDAMYYAYCTKKFRIQCICSSNSI